MVIDPEQTGTDNVAESPTEPITIEAVEPETPSETSTEESNPAKKSGFENVYGKPHEALELLGESHSRAQDGDIGHESTSKGRLD